MKSVAIKVGVIGAGSMGSGIAQLLASHGHEVVLNDIHSAQLGRARTNIERSLKSQIERGRIDEVQARGILNRISFAENILAFTACELVIEAALEDLKIKQEIFRQLEDVVTNGAILASNTSSLSIASIAAACKRKPQRVLGMHFFNPPMVLPLVEIIPNVTTSPEIVVKARALVESWGKVTVVAKDTPGFIVNRIARPFYGESLRILEEGIADIATIDWALKELGGFKMGPFELMDFIGNDINYRVTESVFEALFYDPKYKPSLTQKRLVEAGHLGRKTSQGHYNYHPGAVNSEAKKDPKLGQEILMRVLCMLINEAADALLFQIASREDIDLAMTKGVNYPKGLLAWADELGVKKVLSQVEALYELYSDDRYRPSAMLKRLAKAGKSFYE